MRILFLLLILAGCARHHQANYTVSPGESFNVDHLSNPSTGYRCTVRTGDAVRLDSSRFVQNSAPEGCTGVGGHETHWFTALHQGLDTVTFVYSRGDGVGVETRRYSVWVR